MRTVVVSTSTSLLPFASPAELTLADRATAWGCEGAVALTTMTAVCPGARSPSEQLMVSVKTHDPRVVVTEGPAAAKVRVPGAVVTLGAVTPPTFDTVAVERS